MEIDQPRVHRRQGRARPAAVHRAARAARGPRRPADHQHQRRAAAGLQQRAEARRSTSRSRRRRWSCWRSRSAIIALLIKRSVARARSSTRRSAWASTARRSPSTSSARCTSDAEDDTGPVWARDDDPRAHAGRPLAAPLRPRRAAAVLERAAGRHVDRRPAAGAAVLRRAVQAPHPAVHAAPQGEGRHHRLGAGQRLARQHVAREADRVRPVLHRELVGRRSTSRSCG